MVRTRNMGSLNDVLPREIPSHEYRRRQENRITIEDELEDSDESDFSPVIKRRRICRSRRSPPQTRFTGVLGGSSRGLQSEKHGRQLVEDDDDDIMDAKDEGDAHKSSGFASGIRRSTRQRKFTYDTLNQRWLLSSDRYRDYSALVEDEEQKSKKNRDFDEGSNHNGDFDDMYSRVKRERRKASLNFYELTGNQVKKNRQRAAIGDTSSEETCDDDVDEEIVEGDPEDIEQLACDINGADIHDDDSRNSKYYLRQKKPMIERFQAAIEPRRQRKPPQNVFHMSPARRHTRSDFHSSFRSPAHRSPRIARRRHATHNSSTPSSSSSSSDEEDERRFERRKAKSMARARNSCLPMNLTEEDIVNSQVLRDRNKIGSSLADVDPMAVDRMVSFDKVGGHGQHITSLKEMLLLPLMYPEVFEKFKITPPRGVLFYGPPGTGKTLVARALANECSDGERRVAFFMRKGADCLSKWVGESERQLRLLFDQAYSMRPSIIFFDEIDGLAPVRSSRQDQIHSSIVSTLLALMDGLDNRGEVVVIGATNRIDAIDPALRRPGRFDREFCFPLPSLEARLAILNIHTRDWNPPLSDMFLEELSEKTVGYCGADIKGLCAEAAFLALRRRYPQIYRSRQKLQLDISSIKIEAKDFYKAITNIVPVAQRSSSAPERPLPPVVRPLLLSSLNSVLEALKSTFPQGFTRRCTLNEQLEVGASHDIADNSSDEDSVVEDMPRDGVSLSVPLNGIVSGACGVLGPVTGSHGHQHGRTNLRYLPSHRPRLILAGHKGQGQSAHVAPAVLHHLERFPTLKLDLPALYAITAKSPEESCAQIFVEAQRNLPSILYLPHIGQWWETLSDTVRATFLTLLNDLEPAMPLLLLATSDCPFVSLPDEVKEIFDPRQGEVHNMRNPSRVERRQFFADLILYETKRPPKLKLKRSRKLETLPLAPPPAPRALSEVELKKIRDQEENTLRELRLFLREILYKLARERRFSFFTKPVDTEEVSDYLQVIKDPMDLETMMTKIDLHKYESVADFLDDIDLICHNALEYNPDRDPSDKMIRHRACALRDSAHCLISTELDPEFEDICQEIKKSRKERGDLPSKYAPQHYHTLPRPPALDLEKQATGEQASSATVGHPSETDSASGNGGGSSACPKRCSRRLRGLDVGNTVQQSETSKGVASNSRVSSAKGTMKRHTAPPVIRYRRGLWFGQRRRVRPRHSLSCSEESLEAKAKTAVGTKRRLVLNGDIYTDEDSVKGEEGATSSSQRSESTIQFGNGEVNGFTESSIDSEEIPLDPLTSSLFASEDQQSVVGGLLRESKCAGLAFENDLSSLALEGDAATKLASHNRSECPSSLQATGGASKEMMVAICVEKLKDYIGELHHKEAGTKMSDLEMDDAREPELRTVVIDQSRLGRALEAVVARTEGATVEQLEKLHCRLHQLIRMCQHEWDRTGLLIDLEKEIHNFMCLSTR